MTENKIENSLQINNKSGNAKLPDCKKDKKQFDMLNGSLALKLFLFALPLAASSILQQLFNSADVAVVGRFAGKPALAAVGSNATVTALFVNIFVGLSVGCNVAISWCIGKGEEEKIKKIVSTAITFSLVCGIVLFCLGPFIARPLLSLMGTPTDVLDKAVAYLVIYFIGIPATILFNFGSAILRSIGDTKRPMYILVASGIINLLLNLFLVIVIGLGVEGVAIATVIANIFSAFVVVWILCNEKSVIKLDLHQLGIDKTSLRRIIKVGAPAALQSAVFSLSNIFIQSGINSFGSDTVAGSSTALNFEYFTYFVINAFSQTAVTFVGQNYGAGKHDRCKKIIILCLLEGMLLTQAMSFMFGIFRVQFVWLYTKESVVAKFAYARMMRVMFIECLTGTYEIVGSAMRGMGYSFMPALLTVIGSVGFRIIWIFTVFKKYHTFNMLMSVYPVSWILTGIMVVTAYLILRKKMYK